MAARDAPGGWTADRLAEWGVPWPPPAFWLKQLIKEGVPYQRAEDGSDDITASPYMTEQTRKRLGK